MKRTYSPFGAVLNIHLCGSPDELAREVNGLFNYGAIANVPGTYREGEHESVTVQATKAHLLTALAAQVENEWKGNGKSKTFKGRPVDFAAAAADESKAIFASQYVRERADFLPADDAGKAGNHFPDLPLNEDELPRAVMRAKWAAIAPIFGGVGAGDSASAKTAMRAE